MSQSQICWNCRYPNEYCKCKGSTGLKSRGVKPLSHWLCDTCKVPLENFEGHRCSDWMDPPNSENEFDGHLCAPVTADPVNPEHYKTDGLECIDAIRAALGEEGFKSFCRGNVIKYSWRSGKKDHQQDGSIPSLNEDMKKATWYASMAAGVDPRPDENAKTDKKEFE